MPLIVSPALQPQCRLVLSLMIRWRVAELLAARDWTPYRLAKEAGFTVTLAYRLAKPDAVQRIDAATLERLCEVLGVEPGELLARDDGERRRTR